MKTSVSRSLQALGRLLANENSASDLLALLAELDEGPLSSAFDLSNDREYQLRREVAAGKGRLDVVVVDADTKLPAAVVEMKGASDLHGDQLERYSTWAKDFDPRPKLFLCAFDRDEEAAEIAWTQRKLSDVFSAWKNSEHPHVSWLANEIVLLLDTWDREADARVGTRTGYYVPDILTKRLARDLNSKLHNHFHGRVHAGAYRDNGGSPMALAWTAHPRDPVDDTVVIGVDLRSPTRRSKSTRWRLRPFLQVDVTVERDLKEARVLAFELAWDIREAMGHQRLSDGLASRGQNQLANALSVRRNDGFKKSTSDFDFQTWTESINGESRYPNNGAFFHDKGRRLATIIDLDVENLSRHDLAELVVSTIELLKHSAQATLK